MTQHRLTDGGPYLWELPAWPDGLTWDGAAVAPGLAAVRRAQGRLLAKATLIGLGERRDLQAAALVDEAVTTALIEGEQLDRDSVRSSVARQLGLERAGLGRTHRPIEGLVEVLLDATRRAAAPLTAERLCGWHASLFPTGRSGVRRIEVGAWRTGDAPMQVVSGGFGTPTVHFEAPPSARVDREMTAFLAWFEAYSDPGDGLLRAGLAHLRFVTIHPFDDGNGRLTRALTDLALARDEGVSDRLWSLSAQIELERHDYYRELQGAQRGAGDVTGWLVWFLACVERAVGRADEAVERVLDKVRFWQAHGGHPLNARQLKLVDRLLQAGPGGFVGGMSTRKAVSLTGASRATAQRDLAELVGWGLLRPLPGGGRSTAYVLAWPPRG